MNVSDEDATSIIEKQCFENGIVVINKINYLQGEVKVRSENLLYNIQCIILILLEHKCPIIVDYLLLNVYYS